MSPEPASPAIDLRGIDKAFGAVQANRGVSLSIAAGSITGIVGENGAGKSTLMSILYGLHQADAGEILVDGTPVRLGGPADAIRHGIGMVHQHFLLIETLSVLENVVLGAEGGALLGPGLARARAALAALGRDHGLTVDPDALVGRLPIGEQQRVEILKALYRGARVLILDEPTAVLTPQETEYLFRILVALKARGVTIILITHKLREIMAVTDTVWVMRQGAVVARRDTAATNPDELAELMVGRKVRRALDKAPATPGERVIALDRVGLRDAAGVALLDDVSFDVRAGEIVGVAGVSGNGQSELLELIAGMQGPSSGRIIAAGRVIAPDSPVDPAAMRALGVAHVPEDRLRHGLVAAFDARETAVLGYQRRAPYSTRGLLHYGVLSHHCGDLMAEYDVRPARPRLRSAGFSGGNQQKLILAREIAPLPRALLVGQPTRGVDVGAIELIHRRLVALRDAGCAILMVSVELDEVMALADRILVMCGGRLVGALDRAAADERTLGLMMANAWTPEARP
ncbi:MAG: ABC transporter ATP-binding protein [Alphaproteobacteria bacterium]|nr:ABC transporter ATP-binding protein [Alphaproteobacteria bacterium]